MQRKDIHWPWAPVIIGSGLILLSIVMRMYEFDSAFINLVASTGDIVVIFSLLYIIKIFLIDNTPMSPAMVPAMPRYAPASVPAVTRVENRTSITRPTSRLIPMLQFVVVNVDESTATVTAQAILAPEEFLPATPQQAVMDLLLHQNEVKERLASWAASQHDPSFAITNLGELNIQVKDGAVVVQSRYTLGSR